MVNSGEKIILKVSCLMAYDNIFKKLMEFTGSIFWKKHRLFVKAKRLYESSSYGLFKGRVYCLLPQDFTEKAKNCPRLQKAEELYLQVLPLVQSPQEQFNRGILHCQLGALYHGQGYLNQAQMEYQKAIDLLEGFPDPAVPAAISECFFRLGEICFDWGDVEKATSYFHKSNAIYKTLYDSTGIAMNTKMLELLSNIDKHRS